MSSPVRDQYGRFISEKTPSTEVATVDKVMNQTQLKNLEKLVDGDFEDLRIETLTYLDRQIDVRLRQVDEETADEEAQVAAARAKVETFITDLRLQFDGFASDLTRTTGVAIPASTIEIKLYSNNLRSERRSKAKSAVLQGGEKLKNAASQVLSKTHRGITRQILLQGITGEGASEILSDIPKLEDLIDTIRARFAEEPDALEAVLGTKPVTEIVVNVG